MRIVSREELIKLSGGQLFTEFLDQGELGSLRIWLGHLLKYSSSTLEFGEMRLVSFEDSHSKTEDMELWKRLKSSSAFDAKITSSRVRRYNSNKGNQKFAVFSHRDILNMILALEDCLGDLSAHERLMLTTELMARD